MDLSCFNLFSHSKENITPIFVFVILHSFPQIGFACRLLSAHICFMKRKSPIRSMKDSITLEVSWRSLGGKVGFFTLQSTHIWEIIKKITDTLLKLGYPNSTYSFITIVSP